MKHIRILGLAALMASASVAHALDCANAVSTVDMNDCAAQEQQQVEKQLNAVYQRVLAATPAKVDAQVPAKPRQRLVEAQRAWVKFREADCKAVYELWADGSIRNLQFLGCMQEHAKLRIKQLEAFKQQP
ncbi:lysozyme inhibitor LprI family protein [Mitsuaria sp. GD03876]|uniref:lysozyme inhibitor LprI family protein n=1 Tax=Mitsuaria sp. GD03876 TaxID=2975399 RepID=UPI0024470081|nr:lysozyme inhibitor LprI family protein [Mitsuaria sp. GD03876]MDH0863297.1 lysozyme inhibitor LprI family protein [Mitsuaria sp. GD03876]